MPFRFLLYLQPTNYFRLKNNDAKYVYPKYERLPDSIKNQLVCDENYKSKTAKDYDLSWQSIQQGYIGNADCYTDFLDVSVYDNYVFSRKYFHQAWVLFVLFIRILSLKNPVLEIKNWAATRHVKSIKNLSIINYESWNSFESELLKSNIKISIIIPTLNRYEYLKNVLRDLEQQDYKNFELIIVDQSNPFNKKFYEQFDLNKRIIVQKEKALWLARNTAISASNSDYILLFDDDSRIKPNWVSNHIKGLDFFDSDVSSGVSLSLEGGKIPDNYSYFKISDQIDTGNVLLKKSIFKDIGLFDRQFEKERMGDAEFGIRCQINKYKNISNTFASRLHLKVKTGGLREMGSWDAFRPTNLLAPRPIPSVIYFYRRYFGNKATIIALIKSVPFSVLPYKFKRNRAMMIFGVFIFFLILPFIIIQVLRSWILANKKIKEGPLIEKLG